jgi:outer membrane protein TolC
LASDLERRRDPHLDAYRHLQRQRETTQSINALAEANFGLEASREGLAAAEENYRVRRELYRAGKATIVEVTDAETDLTRARLDVVNSHVDVRIARVALAHALGRDVPAPKQQ